MSHIDVCIYFYASENQLLCDSHSFYTFDTKILIPHIEECMELLIENDVKTQKYFSFIYHLQLNEVSKPGPKLLKYTKCWSHKNITSLRERTVQEINHKNRRIIRYVLEKQNQYSTDIYAFGSLSADEGDLTPRAKMVHSIIFDKNDSIVKKIDEQELALEKKKKKQNEIIFEFLHLDTSLYNFKNKKFKDIVTQKENDVMRREPDDLKQVQPESTFETISKNSSSNNSSISDLSDEAKLNLKHLYDIGYIRDGSYTIYNNDRVILNTPLGFAYGDLLENRSGDYISNYYSKISSTCNKKSRNERLFLEDLYIL